MLASDLLVQGQDAMNQLLRTWWATCHLHIDWHDLVHTLNDGVVIENAAA